ncbi:FKBP-type peptidyl-prolyl cis-trans isomerase [Aquimarina algicola]|uniref:peptidylprolyl isomerase n=1 Tax=Aquimarina algicola TaxID=2589995 RepID=A0A504J373_9FLAO|nr:hypothetical protein [Aquimarina algicola]TPN85327.1 hypothetical protein FHK87_15010 [Aquimarina algicola]
MNVIKYISTVVVLILALSACNNDDDAPNLVPPNDRGEQQVTDDALLQKYLETHFYTVEEVDLNGDDIPDYEIAVLDTIAGENSDKEALINSSLLTTKKITRNDVEYNLYVLNINGGEGEYQPTFADSTLVTYRGQLLETDNRNDLFDSAVTPIWFDQISVIEGWREAVVDFKGALKENITVNADGTISATGFGHLIVFMPSGLGYFDVPQTGIPAYSPIIFNMQLYSVNQSDHDRDGIPSYLEDVDGDRLMFDNTDEDNNPNFRDLDDDGDGVLTSEEITVNDANGDGIITEDEITFYDDDNDGVFNHLDNDSREIKN